MTVHGYMPQTQMWCVLLDADKGIDLYDAGNTLDFKMKVLNMSRQVS